MEITRVQKEQGVSLLKVVVGEADYKEAVDKMLQEGIRWNIFNLGTGKGLSVLELVNAFIKATGVNLNYKIAGRRPGDVEQYWADPSKANRELGWSAATPIEEVLLSAWKWQQTL